MKDISKQIESYKKSIQSYKNVKVERLYKLYKRSGYGRIIIENDKEIENIIYKGVAKLLHSKYGDIANEEEVYNRLTMFGRIYTMDMNAQNGFYDKDTANIGVNHFLNKLSNTLVHEIIHKSGALSFNKAFYELHTIYKEAGAEIIASNILRTQYCKEFIYNGNWARFSNTLESRYLLCSLVNQMNAVLGEEYLADTIINGTDSFEKRAKEVFGEDKFNEYTKRLEIIVDREKKYWKKDIYDDNARENAERVLDTIVHEWQNDLMVDVFGKRIKEVSSYEESMQILHDLKDFSEYRIKKDTINQNCSDTFFKEYFEKSKAELQARFPDEKIEIDYDESEWNRKYKYNTLNDERESDREKLKSMKGIGEQESFWDRIFKKRSPEAQKSLPKEHIPSFEQRIKAEVNHIVELGSKTPADIVQDGEVKE